MTTKAHDDYQFTYDAAQATVMWAGSFRLRGTEYTPIGDMLNEAVEASQGTLTLDLSELQFLNSAGINTLYKFILHLREQTGIHLMVRGSERHPWQKKSLENLHRLLPAVQVEFGK